MFWRPLIARSQTFQALQAVHAPNSIFKMSFSTSNHTLGLQDFFDNGNGWAWNEKLMPTGRAWMSAELRRKSFEDLHALWFTCIKEQNKLSSMKQEAARFQLFFPYKPRGIQVRLTMARIKQVLWERRTAFLQAQEVLKQATSKQDVPSETKIELIGKSRRTIFKLERRAKVARGSRRGKNSTWTVV